MSQEMRIKVATYLRPRDDDTTRELFSMYKMSVRVDGDESESNKYVQLKLKNEALEFRGTSSSSSPYCEIGYDKSLPGHTMPM